MTFTLEPCAERGLDHRCLGVGMTPADLAGGRCKFQRVRQITGDTRGNLNQLGRCLSHSLPTYLGCGQAVDFATELRW
jgi:hypothetical protein